MQVTAIIVGRKTTMTVLLFATVVALLRPAAGATTNYSALEAGVKERLSVMVCGTDRPVPPQGTPSDDFYAVRRLTNTLGDVTTEDLVGLLTNLVCEGLALDVNGATERDKVGVQQVGFRAMSLLGELRCREASAFLAGVAKVGSPGGYGPCAAREVIRIGDTNMLDLAREIITDSKSGYRRYVIYRELTQYVQQDTQAELRSSVERFLADVLASVPGYGFEYRADQTLCAASEQWRKSHERAAFLERFKDTVNPTYYADQLKAIQAIPAAERTHVEVHPLRMASPAPPAPPQPASSTNAPASPVSQPAP